MDVICCNCDFVYRPTVLQLQQKSNLAKSGSGCIFTALHGMQTRSRDENSVRLSIKRVHCDKTEEGLSRFLFHTKDSEKFVVLAPHGALQHSLSPW